MRRSNNAAIGVPMHGETKASVPGLFSLGRHESQGRRIDAVAQTSGSRSVIENMPEMGSTSTARHFGATHAAGYCLRDG